jgi:hypothetical protein
MAPHAGGGTPMAAAPDIDFFFRPPEDFKERVGRHSTLHLLRREIQECLVDDPPREERLFEERLFLAQLDDPETQLRRLLAATMLTFAGVDLLAKFHAGTDKGEIGQRFKDFARHYLGLAADAADTLWAIRNALMHSFGPYDPKGGRRLVLDTPPAVRQEAGTWHVSPVAVYRDFVRAIEVYEADVRGGAPAVRARFERMLPNYGTMAIS